MNKSWRRLATLPPSMPAARFPGLLGDMERELAGLGIDPAIVASQLIAFSSLLTQGIADISWPNNMTAPVGGNSLLVAPSGSGKSVVFRILMAPISRFLADLPTKDADQPFWPAFFIEDATREAILHHLRDWPVTGLFTDEAGQLKQLLGNAASTLVKLLDGEPVRHARVSTGRIELIGHRLTMLLMEQPQVFEASKAAFGAGTGGVGFINRFFVASAGGLRPGASLHRVGLPAAVAQSYESKVERLLERTIAMVQSKQARPTLQLSPDGLEFLSGLNDEIRTLQESDPNLHRAAEYAKRHSERTLRLAGALHVFEQGAEGQVQLSTVQAADQLGRWSLDNFLKLTDEPPRLTQAEQDAGVLLQALQQVVQASGRPFLPLSELRRSALNIGLTKSRFERALTVLAPQGKVTVVAHGKADWLHVNQTCPGLLGV